MLLQLMPYSDGGRLSVLASNLFNNSFPPNDVIWRQLMMSHPAMSLGDRLCASRKGGAGEVGGCTRRVQTAWPRLGSALNSPW